jgi:hypothetical protein
MGELLATFACGRSQTAREEPCLTGLKELVEVTRVQAGRAGETTRIIVVSKSIKNADGAEEKGHDAGKKLPESSCTSVSI